MATTATDLIVRDVAVGTMKPGSNARKDPQESELQALGESLKACQYIPVILDPEMNLVDGWRRWLAAKLVGLKTLKAIVTDRQLTKSELRIAQLSMSVHRAGLTGSEMYDTCYELLQLNPNLTAKDLAEQLKMDPSTMTRVLSPSKCIPPVMQALKAGKVGLSDCYAISKEPEERQLSLLELKLSGASRDELEQHRRGGKRRGKGRTPQAKCLLPDGRSIVIAGRDISMPNIVAWLSDALKAARKGCDEGYDVRTWEAMTRDRAKGVRIPQCNSSSRSNLMAKIGEKSYDLGAFVNRGWHELGNSLYPESNIPLRDHSGLYGRGEDRDVEPHEKAEISEPEQPEPELE